MSKEIMLNNVRQALEQNHLNSAKKNYIDLIKHESSDKIKEYIALQNANKGIVVESSDVAKSIAEILNKMEAKKVIYSLGVSDEVKNVKHSAEFIAYDKSIDSMRDLLFGVDTSIIKADCAVSELGIFGLASSKDSPRMASLITKNCIVILDKKDIVKHLHEATDKLKKDGLPNNIIFIAGASRTADIELKTVFGVHGPQIVYIILVG